MTNQLQYVKPLVEQILRSPINHSWTIQGFGFLRTYFGPPATPRRFRLNLWNSRFAVANVSTIHDHPWSFESLVVAGVFANLRYDFTPMQTEMASSHSFTTIKTGEGGGLTRSEQLMCLLTPKRVELYSPGDTYGQMAHEIHETLFKDGSVTINERIGDTEHARVFWPVGTDWVDAWPHPATNDQVRTAADYALREWF